MNGRSMFPQCRNLKATLGGPLYTSITSMAKPRGNAVRNVDMPDSTDRKSVV